MTGQRPQTAVQGVALAAVLNVAGKVLTLLRQVLVTAYFGLSARIDAFFVATSFVAIFINTFGDIFDSAGIPSLVKCREREGEESFRVLAGSIFRLALMLGLGLSFLMVVCLPLAPLIVPGFPAASREYIRDNLLLLLPYAVVFLPYHALGSFFRAVRSFHVYYLVEGIVQLAAVAAVFAFGYSVLVVPASLSAAYVIGILAFVVWGRGRFRFGGRISGGEMDVVRRTVVQMFPVYLIVYGMIVIDRCFASYLEEGAISALFYAYILATAVPGVMNIENVFITPLSEESDRGALLTRILAGVWIVAAPVLAFTLCFAPGIVKALFERGAFTARASSLTADALRFYVLGLPAFFALPVCVRVLQVFRRLRWVMWLSLGSMLLNAALNYLFVLKIGLGVKGIALATSLSYATVASAALVLVSKAGVRLRYAEMFGVFPNVLLGAAVALAGAALVPSPASPLAAVAVQGVVFVGVYLSVAFLLPGAAMRGVRDTVLESFPRLRRGIGPPQ